MLHVCVQICHSPVLLVVVFCSESITLRFQFVTGSQVNKPTGLTRYSIFRHSFVDKAHNLLNVSELCICSINHSGLEQSTYGNYFYHHDSFHTEYGKPYACVWSSVHNRIYRSVIWIGFDLDRINFLCLNSN